MFSKDLSKWGFTVLVAAALLFCRWSVAQAQEDDWEYWGEYAFKYNITDQLAFKVTPKMQVRDDFSNPYYWESAHGLSYKFNKTIDVGAYHLFAEEDRRDTNKTESRLRLEMNLHTLFKGVKFSDRSRYEYRTFNIGESKDRYRNRIQVTLNPVTLVGQEITPYVSNEFFYDLEEHEYNQNRGIVGFTKKLTEKISAGMYYMLRSNRAGDVWNEVHIIGTKFDISLNYSPSQK